MVVAKWLNLSELNKYEFEHITARNMDLPTKPTANLFFKFSRWRSFGIRYIEGGGDRLEVLDGIELPTGFCVRRLCDPLPT